MAWQCLRGALCRYLTGSDEESSESPPPRSLAFPAAHRPEMPSRSLPLVGLLFCATAVRAEVALAADSLLDYVPDLAGNIVFAILYTLLSAVFFWHVFLTGPKLDKWALVLPIGSTFEALGFWLRIPMRTSQASQGLYIAMYLFVVLSPAAFLAFNYILFGRFTAALEGSKPSQVRNRSRYSFLPPRMVKRIFVTSDVVTFLIQAAGGGLQTSGNYKNIQTGDSVFLAGTILQTVSYLLFTALVIVAHARLYRDDRVRYHAMHLSEPVVQLFGLLYISSIGILIRSWYRVVEFSQGYGGYLYSTEVSASHDCLCAPSLLTPRSH